MELTFKSVEISRNISLMVPLPLVSYRKRPVETVMESYGTWYGAAVPKLLLDTDSSGQA